MSSTRQGPISGVAQAAAWRLLGVLFERPHEGWRREVAALAQEVGDSEIRAVAAAAQEATEGRYMAVLGPGGVVSPREVTYRSFEDPGKILADLAGFYEAFGFHPHAEDPIDHVAIETGFVGYLLLKEAYGRLHEDPEAAEITAAARQRFVETHLGPLAVPFAERLSADGAGYLTQAAELLAARVPNAVATPEGRAAAQALPDCSECSCGEPPPEDELL